MGHPLKEKTQAQVAVSTRSTFSTLPPTYKTYREMAKHPTIAVGRALAAAPALAAEWTVESDDDALDEWVQFIQDEVVGKRHQYLEHAVYGRIDYGYAPYEKVFAVRDGRIVVDKIKPLIQELTELLTSETTGALVGIKQATTMGAGEVNLELDAAMVLSFSVHGTNWYGQALLENCREAWNNWNEANEGAKRYDSKVAGGHVIVRYPQGTSVYNNTETDNQDIAKIILDTIQSAGSVSIPTNKQDTGMEEAEDQWNIVFDDSGAGMQPQFRDRLEYFDKLMARGMLLPERALQEGTHGTLAEAESHGEVALVICELATQTITRGINEQLVDPLLALNYGPATAGKVRIMVSPLTNKQRAFLEGIYTAYLTNPMGFMAESEGIDTDSLKDLLGIPKATEIAKADNQATNQAEEDDVDGDDPRAATVRRVYSEIDGNA